MRNREATYSSKLVFSSLADPTRRSILDLLCSGRRAAGRIADGFNMSRPAVSKHLTFLVRANLIRVHREGRHRFYELNAEPLKVIDSWLNRYRVFWNESLIGLKEFVENETAQGTPTARRKVKQRKRRNLI
ncbi:MAG TPA: metalloregulator ArsR/SmtB family transcription factor [Bryobacteraceae bacterium]|nr:metalloregulator ArsR/SmtB family transcription factor [Bryobacteraceae bacterium]